MPLHAPDEAARLDALRRHNLLDSRREESFDDYALLASALCSTPIAAISLVDEARQWFKASVGLGASETPREHSFCAHAIQQEGVMVVEDATRDSRFAANPFVTSDPHIRFYAGAPLVDSAGFALGSVCVIDREPRQLAPKEAAALQALARRIIQEIEVRDVAGKLASALEEVKRVRGLLPICSHCKSVRTGDEYWQSVESYLAEHLDTDCSHGICEPCLEVHHPRVLAARRAARAGAAATAGSF